MVKKKNNFKFEGYDYEELAEALSIQLGGELDNCEIIRDFLREHYKYPILHADNGPVEIISACRKFAVKLAKNSMNNRYDSEVLEAIAMIEDDHTFFRWFVENLHRMWI